MIIPARPYRPKDKAYASYCTLFACSRVDYFGLFCSASALVVTGRRLLLDAGFEFGALLRGLPLSHGLLGFEMDAVRAMNDAIKDCISKRWIADVVMPVTDW